MALFDPTDAASPSLLFADVTQSWSEVGGGVRTYLRHKRRHIIENSTHRHLMIVPGPRDAIEIEHGGRAITAFIASPKLPGSPQYRWLLRNRVVRSVLQDHRPGLIECQDAYNLPWAAIGHARQNAGTALVRLTARIFRPFTSTAFPNGLKGGRRRRIVTAIAVPHRQFDAVYAMSEHGGAARLRSWSKRGRRRPAGVELGQFSPASATCACGVRRGWMGSTPWSMSAGSMQKRPQIVVDAFEAASLGVHSGSSAMGPLREQFRGGGRTNFCPGFAATAATSPPAASADIYVNGHGRRRSAYRSSRRRRPGFRSWAAAGAMVDRVPRSDWSGRSTMRRHGYNILAVLGGDRAAMGERARSHALQFSWGQSMARLFGRVYRRALTRAAERTGYVAPLPQPALAEAA
jgi:alpha-1,6-mannosyltransferase